MRMQRSANVRAVQGCLGRSLQSNMDDPYTLSMVSVTTDGTGGEQSCPIRRSILWIDHKYPTTAKYLLNQPLDIFEY